MSSLLAVIQELPGWILVSLGFYISFRILKFPDLTVDASFATGACATAMASVTYQSSLLGLILAILLGGSAGGVTGLVYLSNPRPAYKLVAGALVVFAFYSLNYRLLGHRTDLGFRLAQSSMNKLSLFEANQGLSAARPLTLLVGIILVCIVMWMFWFLLRTKFGLGLRAIGTRPFLVSTVPLRRKLYLVLGLVLCNATVAVGAWYLTCKSQTANLKLFGTIIHALAAAIIGEMIAERLLRRDRRLSIAPILLAPIIGTALYQSLRAGITWLLRDQYGGEAGSLGAVIHQQIISINQQDNNTLVAVFLLAVVLGLRYLTELVRGYKLDSSDEEWEI